MNTALKIIGAIVGGLLILVLAVAITKGVPKLPHTNTAPVAELPATAGSTDGQWLIGTDMPAGTYRTAGPADSYLPQCYWERTSDASGEFRAIIANSLTEGPQSVTVQIGEYFTSRGCLPWQPA